MNILYNNSEQRFRAGIRIIVFLVLSVLLIMPIRFVTIGWVASLLISLGCFVAAFLVVKGMDKRSISSIGLDVSKVWWIEFGLGVLIAFLAQTIIFSIEYGFSWLEITGYGWQRAGIEMWGWSAFTYFLTMLSVGFYEELLFRGYSVKNLAEGFTIEKVTPQQASWIAVVFTSVLFGFAHAGNPNASAISTFNIILAGFMLAVPFLLTGRLAMSIGIHFSWNWVMGGIYGLPVSGLDGRRSVLQTSETGPDLWTGGKFGPEAGLLGILGMLFILTCILLYAQKRNPSGKLELDESFKNDYKRVSD
ncbi:MAG: CPBP family intramembrane metalloprotease [Balneola sp.]|nr:CPBP family intramembrane metalloprotease [Balneola sp.]MBO6652221.1 CPBP family intramembrane metalloprotease [Balneola sp.]MBO6712726.1 CPBP family intramembrane metalloprotease [Balneola sp.]MBO6801388.1 CPBP family intramembrane metalloprotease [Balneola sp.]MBO6871899.1 CPBP family intramembrane metalloprotease [Balneola sp.]